MHQNIVTSGQRFTDIDALACAVAYSELLVLDGKESEVVLPGILNASVTQAIKDWGIEYTLSPTFTDADYTIVDVSDPLHMAECVTEDRIVKIFDHHLGFEDYWQERIGERAHIEFIGSCATLIWEEYRKRNQQEHISTLSRHLLAVAILSNTLNFGAQMTHERDQQAFQELQALHPLSDEWRAQYFADQEEAVNEDIAKALLNDTKIITDLNLKHPLVIGQLELWNGSDFLAKNTELIKQTLESFKSEYWFMSIPSLKEKKNYIYTENPEVKELLSRVLDITFEGERGVTKKLWLRKEILRELYSLK